MDEQFHRTLYTGCKYLSMLGFQLIYVNKRGPCSFDCRRDDTAMNVFETILSVCGWASTSHTICPCFFPVSLLCFHYKDVIMSAMASQITSLTIVYSTVYSAQIKENIKAPVTRKMFPFDDVIMLISCGHDVVLRAFARSPVLGVWVFFITIVPSGFAWSI